MSTMIVYQLVWAWLFFLGIRSCGEERFQKFFILSFGFTNEFNCISSRFSKPNLPYYVPQRIWPKIQWKRFLVHTVSLNSFTLESKYFRAANSSLMSWTFKKLGEKRVFEHIFLSFYANFVQKWLKRVENKRFSYNLLKVRSIPEGCVAKIFERWIPQTRSKEQKPNSLSSRPYTCCRRVWPQPQAFGFRSTANERL